MKYRHILTAIFVFILAIPVAPLGAAVEVTAKGVSADLAAATGVADGAYNAYAKTKDFKRTDFRVIQDGGSGAISFQVFATWEPGADTEAEAAALTYSDVGLDFYGSAVFSSAEALLIDDGARLAGATWVKLVFTVIGASSDASYSVNASYLYPGV